MSVLFLKKFKRKQFTLSLVFYFTAVWSSFWTGRFQNFLIRSFAPSFLKFVLNGPISKFLIIIIMY